MDWYAWLSAARLEPALVQEYALVFARNELEAGDVAYFDHDFLHSMGISVARHRLEILRLARLGRARRHRLLAAVGRIAVYVRRLVRRREEHSTALVLGPCQQQLVVVGRASPGPMRGGGDKTPKRTKCKSEGATAAAATTKATRPAVLASGGRGAAAVHAVKDAEQGGGGGEEMVRWDRLFQNLNPN